MKETQRNDFFGTESIPCIFLKIAPPVMFVQLIQSLYNLVDSYFIGRISESGLTALAVIYPVQLLINALGVGTGIGINTVMSRKYGEGKTEEAKACAGVGSFLAVMTWVLFVLFTMLFFDPYIRKTSASEAVVNQAMLYGKFVCCGSLPLFLDSVWTRIHQAGGDVYRPMMAQIAGAGVNLMLDPILIFGVGIFPAMGIRGAAIATVTGQFAAACFNYSGGFYRIEDYKKIGQYAYQIYKAGIPAMLMQALFTVYISGLNLVLALYSEVAVTVLGLYYKLQTFFFIPFMALENCIVPVLSYNYGAKKWKRCVLILVEAVISGMGFMLIGAICFEVFPEQLLKIFTSGEQTLQIGRQAFRIIGSSFIPAVPSLLIPIFFQAIGKGKESMFLTILRQVILFVPLAWIFGRMGGLLVIWYTFPATELFTTAAGFLICRKVLKNSFSFCIKEVKE